MNSKRSWMYARLKDGLLNPVFLQGLDEFIEFAKRHPKCMDGIKIKCPCNHRKCQNRAYHDENTVRYHLMKYGFVRYYYQWILHGESSEPNFDARGKQDVVAKAMPSVGGLDFSPPYMEEAPNATQKNFDMLKAAKQEDRYLELEDQASQTQEKDDGSPIVDKADLFYQAVRGEKKRRLYGVGSQTSIFYP